MAFLIMKAIWAITGHHHNTDRKHGADVSVRPPVLWGVIIILQKRTD